MINTIMHTIADVTFKNPLPKTPDNLLVNMLNVAMGALGGISLIVVVWAGMKYTLSSGDSAKTAEAKNQIIYAAVGIVVAISAATIVQFTIGKI